MYNEQLVQFPQHFCAESRRLLLDILSGTTVLIPRSVRNTSVGTTRVKCSAYFYFPLGLYLEHSVFENGTRRVSIVEKAPNTSFLNSSDYSDLQEACGHMGFQCMYDSVGLIDREQTEYMRDRLKRGMLADSECIKSARVFADSLTKSVYLRVNGVLGYFVALNLVDILTDINRPGFTGFTSNYFSRHSSSLFALENNSVDELKLSNRLDTTKRTIANAFLRQNCRYIRYADEDMSNDILSKSEAMTSSDTYGFTDFYVKTDVGIKKVNATPVSQGGPLQGIVTADKVFYHISKVVEL